MKHGQVEAAAVPGHKVRRVAFETVVEPADQLGLARVAIAKAPDVERIPGTQGNGDGDHAMLVERQELAAGGLLPDRRHRGGDILVAQAVEVVHATPELYVGNGFNIKRKTMHYARFLR